MIGLDSLNRGAPLSRHASRMSLLAGFIAAETYEAYAVFVAHALTAPSVFIFNPFTGRHLLPGQVGSLGESFSWNGVIPLFIGTMLAFALAWILAREAAGHYAAARPPLSKGHSHWFARRAPEAGRTQVTNNFA